MFQSYKMRLQARILAIFFVLFDTPTALLLPSSVTSLIDPNDVQHGPRSPDIQKTSLQTRMPLGHPGVNWHLGFLEQRFAIINPAVVVGVSVIVSCLIIIVRLLSRILDTCITLWAYNTPANQVVIEAGNMRLEFGCAMEPVPWEFIAEFAASRRDATKRGFAPGYSKEWWFNNRHEKRICYAGIRLVPDGGEAERPRLL